MRARKVLAIAGLDPSGGAGLLADVKTISAHGCYAMGVVTALTAQNTQGVSSVAPVAADFVVAQIDALFADGDIDAVKIGMLATPETVRAVAQTLRRVGARNVVLDPVLISTSGAALGGPGVSQAIIGCFPGLVGLITPNLHEAATLLQKPQARDPESMGRQALELASFGMAAALVKGGHLDGEPVDMFADREGVGQFRGARVATRNTHGTGCALSSAIASQLARGESLLDAIGLAKRWLEDALAQADRLEVGRGRGPPHHFAGVWRSEAEDG